MRFMIFGFALVLILGVVLYHYVGKNGIPGANANTITGEQKMNDRNGITSEQLEDIPEYYSLSSTVGEIEADPSFGEFGNLLFPVDRNVSEDMTLEDLSSSSVYVWYSHIKPEKTVEIVNTLKEDAEAGNQIFYNIYSESEMEVDPSKQDTGLFFFRGNPGEKYAIMNAGGGFMYVGAMHDSFPHALEVSKMGYNSFALIYRPDSPYEDLAAAISFITDHADELQVDPEGYSLWGGSAGARMAATLGNKDYLGQLTGRTDLPQAAAVIMQYTGYTSVSVADAPTYACVGDKDGIANWNIMKTRLESLEGLGISTEFHVYEGLSHGFGLGTGTVAEGWLNDAVEFWKKNTESSNATRSDDYVVDGKDTYQDFVIDSVLYSETQGEIHYCVYIPESYDGNEPYALFVTLPGYEGLYFQGVAENIKAEKFGFEAQKYNEKMIVVAPQLDDWGQTSSDQTIALTEYFLNHYNINQDEVYINGYSGGGETLSLVLDTKPELYTKALMCSSQWDGGYQKVVSARVPVYFVIGESDEYYGSKPFIETYNSICQEYQQEGLTSEEIEKLVLLDVKDKEYFESQNISNQHGGGSALFSVDDEIMEWLLKKN
ncbi:MAG: prolyl oligopeptidase family serine peptidase [Lachnospiraceae bacterium]|nr:prolyl oligopeptidase family serine peptidase [Lachnospiraceae bacterium]MDD3616700.1 prolyl oligopeptidase family serine peptidase [Lachnospiraceae bacterium]